MYVLSSLFFFFFLAFAPDDYPPPPSPSHTYIHRILASLIESLSFRLYPKWPELTLIRSLLRYTILKSSVIGHPPIGNCSFAKKKVEQQQQQQQHIYIFCFFCPTYLSRTYFLFFFSFFDACLFCSTYILILIYLTFFFLSFWKPELWCSSFCPGRAPFFLEFYLEDSWAACCLFSFNFMFQLGFCFSSIWFFSSSSFLPLLLGIVDRKLLHFPDIPHFTQHKTTCSMFQYITISFSISVYTFVSFLVLLFCTLLFFVFFMSRSWVCLLSLLLVFAFLYQRYQLTQLKLKF